MQNKKAGVPDSAEVAQHIAFLAQRGVERLHVTPEFYIGWTRFVCQEIEIINDQCWCHTVDSTPHYHWPSYSDVDIIEKRLGDKLTYMGLSVRLAKQYR